MVIVKRPGGGSARIRVKRDSYPEGSDCVGGVPDIEYAPTVEGKRAGRDRTLELALETVRRLASESAR